MNQTMPALQAPAGDAVHAGRTIEPCDPWLCKVAEYLLEIMIAENPLVASSPVQCAQLAGNIIKLLFEKQ